MVNNNNQPSKARIKMKTKGTHSFSARRIGAAAAIVFALVATALPSATAAGEVFGKACPTEGVSTGTSSSSLVCKESSNGKLTWQRVRLGQTYGAPVGTSTPPKGSIEFWHYRPEDKAVFQTIIDRYEARYPGTKITQVVSSTSDYDATARVKISGNKEAALFAASRGATFNGFATADMYLDISDKRFVRQNAVANALFAGQYGGKQVGIPYHYLFNDPVYNTEIFAKEGWTVPKNFSGVLAYCKAAKAKGYVPMAWMGAVRGQAAQIFNSMLMNSTADYATLEKNLLAINTGKESLTTPWFKSIAENYKKMLDGGCFPDNPTGMTEAAGNNLFATGKAPILPTGSFSMGAIKVLNPAMTGKMQLMGLIATDAAKPNYVGIHNSTFILGVNNKATSSDQRIALSFLSYLMQGEIGAVYANGTTQHVNVLNVSYSANIDLLNTSVWQGYKTLLAPRFLITDAAVSNLTNDALIAIVGGKAIDATLADFSNQIKQKLSA
jgi:raffinose/stachyose/melibiose transport system substrate-binding protein